jgi:hypothetical protein
MITRAVHPHNLIHALRSQPTSSVVFESVVWLESAISICAKVRHGTVLRPKVLPPARVRQPDDNMNDAPISPSSSRLALSSTRRGETSATLGIEPLVGLNICIL